MNRNSSGGNQRLLIARCPDPMRWYAGLVGQAVPYLGDVGTEYKSREPDGYVNFVQYADAMIVSQERVEKFNGPWPSAGRGIGVPLVVSPDAEGRIWTLEKPLLYRARSPICSHIDINVPAGFRTDFASIPRLLWPILPPYGKYGNAAVLHDFLYVNGGQIARSFSLRFTRKECDAIFLKAMEDVGVGRAVRIGFWLAVRLFGGRHFGRAIG